MRFRLAGHLACAVIGLTVIGLTVTGCTQPPDLTPGAEKLLRNDVSMRLFDTGLPDKSIDVTLPVAPGTQSMLTSIALEDPTVGVTLSRLLAPDGSVWHAEDDNRFDSLISGVSFSSIGELSVYLPLSPARPLQSGDWQARFSLETAGPVRRLSMLAHVVPDPDQEKRVIDMVLGIATEGSRLRTASSAGVTAAILRTTMDQTLAPHGLAIGRLLFIDDERLRDFATLDPDASQASEACRILSALSDSALTFKALLIDRFESIDVESVDGTLALSPQPGTLFDPQSFGSCAFVAVEPFMVDGLSDAELDQQLGATLLHEAGHFMGLDHTSEADGEVFDLLMDTPECRVEQADGRDNRGVVDASERDGFVDDFECGISGGANNLMFWSGVSDYAPFVLTESQAWVLRRHPLFLPAEVRE